MTKQAESGYEKGVLLRSTEVNSAIFWIVASGLVYIAGLVSGIQTGFFSPSSNVSYAVIEVVVVVLYFILVYPCFTQKSWGFISSIVLSAFLIVATIGTEGLEDPLGDLFIVMGFLTIYFSYFAYVKVKRTV
ncbi:MAG: hypothetical protein JRN20_19405 [Nitrososphaerota archaeon]|nr:hypothetical protein [Nitrososphaerota archaeon]MDG6921780.1 hypothetical protein [Nitrososphaerota archaeon]